MIVNVGSLVSSHISFVGSPTIDSFLRLLQGKQQTMSDIIDIPANSLGVILQIFCNNDERIGLRVYDSNLQKSYYVMFDPNLGPLMAL